MNATLTEAKPTIKAIVCTRPGPVDRLRPSEIPAPVVTNGGLLVRVHASSANPVDLFPTSPVGYVMSRKRPLVLGTDFAGTVEAVGEGVTEFGVGDAVFGGMSGAFAELISLQETAAITRMPANATFEQAGTVAVAATTALQALRDHGRLRPGQHVLINGASGGVGTFAVQIAKALGAEVTAVCSPRNVEMVRSLGADMVIDYTTQDFTRLALRYDLIIDIAGTHSLRECRRVLKPAGTFVGTGAAGIQHSSAGTARAFGHFIGTRIAAIGHSQRVVSLFIAQLNKKDMTTLAELIESGRMAPVIERRYDLDQVAAALSYLSEGHARGKLAIRTDQRES